MKTLQPDYLTILCRCETTDEFFSLRYKKFSRLRFFLSYEDVDSRLEFLRLENRGPPVVGPRYGGSRDEEVAEMQKRKTWPVLSGSTSTPG